LWEAFLIYGILDISTQTKKILLEKKFFLKNFTFQKSLASRLMLFGKNLRCPEVHTKKYGLIKTPL
jgi:hypothetical protein